MPVHDIVPFGKYKGQPVESLAQDREYCEWLGGQEWFRSRFSAIHTLIVNNFGASAETPEHNALQAWFTDRAWVDRFAARLVSSDELEASREWYLGHNRLSEDEVQQVKSVALKLRVSDLKFEVDGADVEFYCQSSPVLFRFLRVECKPVLGDDYPAVLRQMKASKCGVLLVGSGGYTGTGATIDQVATIFRTAGITIVHLSDVGEA